MKYLIVFLSVLAFVSAQAQRKNSNLVIGTIDSIYSKTLKEERKLLIYVPYNGQKKERYPVLYLLDAESHFNSSVAIIQQMSGVLPDMIVVGIPNTIRNRDLTTTHVTTNKLVDINTARISGGGANFISFIEKELIPYIDNNYPTAPYRVFSGHSLGGLTVVNALINHKDLFNAYIAIDPSLWWDNQQLLKHAETKIPNLKFNNRTLFVAMANNMPAGMDTISVMKDTNINTSVTRSVLPFIRLLRSSNPKGLRWTSKFYPNERHGTVELIAEYDALRFLFDYYQFRTSIFTDHPELKIDSVLDAHFKKLSFNLGYKVVPSESLVNELAYTCMGLNKYQEAYNLFIKNIEIYPNSANAYDSMGDYYNERGYKLKAIGAYIKSLALQENTDTRQKLNSLQNKR